MYCNNSEENKTIIIVVQSALKGLWSLVHLNASGGHYTSVTKVALAFQ